MKVKIQVEAPRVETEFDVTFPFYRKNVLGGYWNTVYKVISPILAYQINKEVSESTDGRKEISFYATEDIEPMSQSHSELDFLLGRGEYAATVDDWNAMKKEFNEFNSRFLDE